MFPSTCSANTANKSLIINEKKINIQIWDTPEQEKFRTLANIFMKNANVFRIVYDITKRDTFEEIKNIGFIKYYNLKKNFL